MKETLPIKQKTKVIHKYWSKDDKRQEWLNYLYRKSWYDKDLVLTFLAENWNMWITRKSLIVWANWHSDYWICQINTWYHPDILAWNWFAYWSWKYFKEWFYNFHKQADYCIKKYKTWTRFYWYDVRHKVRNKLIFK